MSWDTGKRAWVPEDPDHTYFHLLFTSRENLDLVVDWLEKITPPWGVYVHCFGDGQDVVRSVQMLGALEYQSWGMFLVTAKHHKEIHEAEFPIYDYLDSRMRVPMWMR